MTIWTSTDRPATERPERFQFRIRDLLLVMVLVALAAGAAVQQSFLLFLVLVAAVGFSAYLWRSHWISIPLTYVLAGAIGAAVVIALLLPAFQTARINDRQASCGNNLKQIVIALHNYHDVYGTLPPAYIADESGKPMHSWRVLLLPFMEHKPLYDEYRFDEPWDGPNNRLLADRIRRAYSCPSALAGSRNPVETNYVAIVGPRTPWPGQKVRSFPVFKDGTANVILVVEVVNSQIHWMEPRDLNVAQMTSTINSHEFPNGQGICSAHQGGAQVGMADGAVRFLKDDTPPDVLRSLINIDDGGVLPP
jgi:prepilin-type processing-associated H-X9-DG protein